MIRSVSRYAVEINRPDSPYFERVICFVRPEFSQEGCIDLHSRAADYIQSLNCEVESVMPEEKEPESSKTHRSTGWIASLPVFMPLVAAALGGSLVTIGVALLIICL